MTVQTFEDADFLIRCCPDGSTFAVNRKKLENGSHVFRDMFSCCDAGAVNANTMPLLELHEPESAASALLRLIHSPPQPPVQIRRDPSTKEKVPTKLPIRYDLSTAIPAAFDKYALSDPTVMESLSAHLLANAPLAPLQVYGFAVAFGDMPRVVSQSSQYVLPVAWYSSEDIKAIPTVEDYHNLVVLQAFRVRALQDILLREDLFPHGYGMCATHNTSATAVWDRTRLTLARKIETNTDVAGEMETLVYIFQSCAKCSKAFLAAVEMLAYKCRRVPRRLDQLAQVPLLPDPESTS
ncbi:hypothetical protein C8J57DRAFT_1268508 [Mycena rebaudengoi]|nr:hypothetical protein C8J57DRAFT_1268508 [Mycena rebaudengoi]